MCILCKEEMMSKLNIREAVRAGMELLRSAKDDEEFDHITEVLDGLEEKLKVATEATNGSVNKP